MLFGIIVISFLFLGFPAFWDKLIAIFCGLIIIFISFRLKPEPVRPKKYSYVEHKNTEEQSTRTSISPKMDSATSASPQTPSSDITHHESPTKL